MLSAVFAEISAGPGLVLLMPGPSGAGKTALGKSLCEPVRHRNGFFFVGKFNQYQQDIPLFAIRQALGDLGRQMLALEPAERVRWKAEILSAVGELGGLVTALAPELELFLGLQPAVPDISPFEASHRFAAALRNFFAVFCRAEHPVVLFIDDWQWADPASLAVLQQLQVGTTLRYLLVVASYRDNEVDAAHPLNSVIADLRRQAVHVRLLPVLDLAAPEVKALLADTLQPAVEDLPGLAAFIQGSTRGNPFFMRTLLEFMHASRALWFEPSRRVWRWQIAPLAGDDGGDVVKLFIQRLRRLPLRCNELLSLAACVGHRFDLEILALVAEQLPAECRASLRPAIEQKLILPLHDGSAGSAADEARAPGQFIFQHDRVQQAAHALIAPDRLAGVQLRIGRLLLARLSPHQLAERLLEVTDHLNAGRALMQDEAEQVSLVQLNVAAAHRAHVATAYRAALHFHRTAGDFLARANFAQRCWRDQPDLTFQLFKAWAESEFLEGDLTAAERCIREAVAHARNPLEQAEGLIILIGQYTMLARYPEAIAAGRQALIGLGVSLPESDFEAARDIEIGLVRQHRDGRTVDALCQAPVMSDPARLMTVRLLITMGPPCYRSHQRLWSVIVPKVVNLTLQYGPVPQVGYSHPAFGGLMGWVANDYATAREFGELATRLMTDVFFRPSDNSVFHLMNGSSLRHWMAHMAVASEDYAQAWETGLRSGNLQYAAYAFGHNMYCRFFQGTPLTTLIQESQQSLQFSQVRHNQWAIDLFEGGLQVFGALAGESPARVGPAAWVEEDYLRSVGEHHNSQVSCIYKVLQATAELVLGHHEHALQLSDEAEALIYTVGTQGLLPWPEHVAARLLILTALFGKANGARQTEWRPELDRLLAQLRIWADNCPENFQPKYWLGAAEMARIDGRPVAAMRFYDQAVDAACAGHFLQWEGLAQERAGNFWRECGQEGLAHDCWQRAYVCYDSWGAAAKVRAMETAYREDLADRLPGAAEPGQPPTPLERDLRNAVLEQRIAQLRGLAAAARQTKVRLETDTHAGELLRATELLKINIVEHRQSEAALQEERERLTGVIRGANVGTWEWNVQTGETVFNSRWAEIIGYTLEEISPTSIETWIRFVHPDDMKVSGEMLARHFRGELDYYDCEVRMKHRDGRWVWVNDRGMVATWTADGRPLMMRGTHLEITERKQAMEALQESATRLKALFEGHSSMKLIIEPETGAILDANAAAANFYGWSVEELRRMTIQQINTLPPELMAIELAKAAAAKRIRFEFFHRRADGTTREVEVFSTKIETEGKTVLYSIIHDITERRQAADALQHSLEEKTVLLREIHHRVKNNLQIVTSLINLQARRIENRETVDALRDVESRIFSMSLLHEALYRSDNFTRIDFAGFIKELCAHIRLSFGAAADRVQLDQRVDCPGLLLEQSVPCGLIVNELVANALKHAFPGDRGGRLLVELLRLSELKAVLRVSDNGPGLPAGFDPAKSPTLGLRLIVNLAQQLGGHCTFEKSEAGGASIQVTFPLADPQLRETA